MLKKKNEFIVRLDRIDNYKFSKNIYLLIINTAGVPKKKL